MEKERCNHKKIFQTEIVQVKRCQHIFKTTMTITTVSMMIQNKTCNYSKINNIVALKFFKISLISIRNLVRQIHRNKTKSIMTFLQIKLMNSTIWCPTTLFLNINKSSKHHNIAVKFKSLRQETNTVTMAIWISMCAILKLTLKTIRMSLTWSPIIIIS